MLDLDKVRLSFKSVRAIQEQVLRQHFNFPDKFNLFKTLNETKSLLEEELHGLQTRDRVIVEFLKAIDDDISQMNTDARDD